MRIVGIITVLVFALGGIGMVEAQTAINTTKLFEDAESLVSEGKYRAAINAYDTILESEPDNLRALKMSGIASSNEGLYTQSLKRFYTAHQNDTSDVLALTGLGVGFGNLGEYQESRSYLEAALAEDPDSKVIQNYLDVINKILQKYPYTPTEKPYYLAREGPAKIPQWIKPIAKAWAGGQIDDAGFAGSMEFLISKGIIEISKSPTGMFSGNASRIKEDAAGWADGRTDDAAFASVIRHMIKDEMISMDVTPEEEKRQRSNEFAAFETYLSDIANNISKEKRYIEYSNPSGDVIKKFLRDYIKWNFEQAAKSAASKFPNPTYRIVNDTHVVRYKMFVNEQPSGLPLDHTSALGNSLVYWKSQELVLDGQKTRIEFVPAKLRHEANVWITWVVRDLGEGVLGHAHLGKGIVEVTLGDYGCDGSFQLYDVETVQKIMTHELGHTVGLRHSSDPQNIMHPTLEPRHAYCLLD